MMEHAIDPAYLRYQYGTTEKLDLRIEAHQRYSERADDYLDWVLDRLNPRPGDLVVDVGCGRGSYHPLLINRGVRAVLGVDASPGMVAVTQRQANELRLPVVAIEARAERLPLPDASYDVGMANHVLFLVGDVPAALRELRRVLKSAGRAVLTTNAKDHCARMNSLHRTAAARLGYQPVERVSDRFNLDHLPWLREMFPRVERFVREDAFVFPSTETAVRYYASGMVDSIADPPADSSHRAGLLSLVGERIQAIIDREGVFRDPKNSGCFVVGSV
jgi:ubiquinone/menaquinone biosynthesis C-methylase UbiE